MNKKIEFKLHETLPEWWDKEVENNDGVYSSSSKWIKTFQGLGFAKGFYLEVLVNEKRSVLILFYESLIGGVLLTNLPKGINHLLSKISYLRSISMHLQPVIIAEDLRNNEERMLEISNEIVKYIIQFSKKRNVNIKPADYVCFKNIDNAKKLKNSFSELSIAGTVRVPLGTDLDEKYKSLPKNLTGSLKKGASLNVITKEVPVKDFYIELKKSWESYGLAVNPEKYYSTLFNESDGDVKYYMSFHDAKPLAGSAIMFYGKTMSEFSMFATSYSREAKIPGGDVLKWDLIKIGVSRNCSFIDLNMIDAHDEMDEKANNINFFKLKWGGYIYYGITIEQLNVIMSFVRIIKLKLLGK
jgi:hypothetical protein